MKDLKNMGYKDYRYKHEDYREEQEEKLAPSHHNEEMDEDESDESMY